MITRALICSPRSGRLRSQWHWYGLLVLLLSSLMLPMAKASITYATRSDAVKWSFSGSQFSCKMSQEIENFGWAMFEQEAGEQAHFVLKSHSPRMKAGQANIVSTSPAWLPQQKTQKLATVNARHSMTPIKANRKIAERMLAELQQGRQLQVVRQPWYGEQQALKVVVSAIGFRSIHGDYLACIGGLLALNFKQVERSSLYYSNDDDDLTAKVKARLDQVVAYVKADSAIKTLYLDGHTDSEGIRSENLIQSQQRTEKVVDYLIEQGIDEDNIVARWHGERYQIASNQSSKGRAKNRRVTLRLSKEKPHGAMDAKKKMSTETMGKDKQQAKMAADKSVGNDKKTIENNPAKAK